MEEDKKMTAQEVLTLKQLIEINNTIKSIQTCITIYGCSLIMLITILIVVILN